MGFKDIGNFHADMAAITEQIHTELRRSVFNHDFVKDLGDGVARAAKSKLGTYQPGWAPLAPLTMDLREKGGYPRDEPLLVTGALRMSIRTVVVKRVHATDAYVGSSAPQARIQELGGVAGSPPANIPPRPYLRPALIEQTPELLRKVNSEVEDALEQAAGKVLG